jgi:hypothetical protein
MKKNFFSRLLAFIVGLFIVQSAKSSAPESIAPQPNFISTQSFTTPYKSIRMSDKEWKHRQSGIAMQKKSRKINRGK